MIDSIVCPSLIPKFEQNLAWPLYALDCPSLSWVITAMDMLKVVDFTILILKLKGV
jgi:hypothetical protein